MKKISLIVMFASVALAVSAQSMKDMFDEFNRSAAAQVESFNRDAKRQMDNFRDQCNRQYAEFLKAAWKPAKEEAPVERPKDNTPVPPVKFDDRQPAPKPIATQPVKVAPVVEPPRPKPVEPVKEQPTVEANTLEVTIYRTPMAVRVPRRAGVSLRGCSPGAISAGWSSLSGGNFDNTLADCLRLRSERNLCDWAYLSLLDEVGRRFCPSDANGATLLTAWLYAQSGYKMRLATVSASKLLMLYGSRHKIYGKRYYKIDGESFFPLDEKNTQPINVCDAKFKGEKPLSLAVEGEQLLCDDLSRERRISSRDGLTATASVPLGQLEFYNSYPPSEYGGNELTRWAMCANAPLATKTRGQLYPSLREAIAGLDKRAAADKLLTWVQTGFEYEYDDKVWGCDRAFFAEETLFYPYCDCEDRSVLYSRLVRDLLGLDVALVLYPNHVATAVNLGEAAEGDAVMIDGRRFVIADPTYIGAPLGRRMPGLDHSRAQAMVLK